MSRQEWLRLTSIEKAILTNARESDILPGLVGDLDFEDEFPDVARRLLEFVDAGLIEVRRYERWISPDGREGVTPGPVVSRDDLPALLSDPQLWDYPIGESWLGALTLVETEAGKKIARLSPEDIAEREQLT